MKTISYLFRLSAVGLFIASSVSCMTTYDAYGRPVQSVDPGVAVAGIAAAGLVGLAVGNGNDNDHHRHYYRGYGGRGYYGGYPRHGYYH